MIKKILLGLAAVLLILQFFQIDKTNPEYDASKDFMAMYPPSEEVAQILKVACYDCHSYETKYPWYTYTQPLAWWVKDHIDEGRDELNFSAFGNYSPRRADHKLEEGVEYTETEEMPLPSYTWGHSEARLTWEQRELLMDWFAELRPIVYPDSLKNSDS
ncbi:MAG: heme-binding domain-containing protein [Balneola sp.]